MIFITKNYIVILLHMYKEEIISTFVHPMILITSINSIRDVYNYGANLEKPTNLGDIIKYNTQLQLLQTALFPDGSCSDMMHGCIAYCN